MKGSLKLYIERELVKQAKEKGINISQFLEQHLIKELGAELKANSTPIIWKL